jgi:hypothetical protein
MDIPIIHIMDIPIIYNPSKLLWLPENYDENKILEDLNKYKYNSL